MNNTGTLRRIWLLVAQVIAIAAGLLIAWRAFGPAPAAAPRADVVALREAAEPAAISASSSAWPSPCIDYPARYLQRLKSSVRLNSCSLRLRRDHIASRFSSSLPIARAKSNTRSLPRHRTHRSAEQRLASLQR